MTWIELHQSVFHHRKTVDAAADLRVSNYLLVGHLAQLWCWAIDAAPNDGGPLSPHAVVEGSRWPKRSGAQFVDVLLRHGFLDEGDDGLYVHDWEQYAGKLQARRAKNAQRMRSARATHVQDTSAARVEHVHPLPYRTVPNKEQQDDPPLPPHGLSAVEPKPEQEAAKGLTRRLWEAHEELSGRITPPPVADEHQFEQWVRDGLTEADIEAARAEIRAWDTVPEKPWAAFKEALGRMVARRRMGGTNGGPDGPAGRGAVHQAGAYPGAARRGGVRAAGARGGEPHGVHPEPRSVEEWLAEANGLRDAEPGGHVLAGVDGGDARSAAEAQAS